MKTLASCKPSEFLKQTNRIRKSVEKWLTDTEILKIRQTMPKYEQAPKGASAEERKALVERNAELERLQTRENLSKILDAVLEDHPEETLEILALCSFIEPQDADNHTITEYLQAFNELISAPEVIDFFTSLVRLGRTSISNASGA